MINSVISPILLTLMPSIMWSRGVLCLIGLAGYASLVSALPIEIKTLLAVILFFCFIKIYNKPFLSCKQLKYSVATGWSVAADEEFELIHVLPSSVLTKYAVFLQIRYLVTTNRRRAGVKTLVIPKDALSEEDFRCLIVKLKCTIIKQEQAAVSIDRIKSIKTSKK